MRFVELRPAPDGEGIRLHPRIAVVEGLDPAARVAIVGMVHGVALGDAPEWDGTAEIDGTEYSLADAIELMGESGDSALIVAASALYELAPDTDALDNIERQIDSLAEELGATGRLRTEMNSREAAALARIDNSAARSLDRADGALGRAARLADRPDPWTGMNDAEERTEALSELAVELEDDLAALPTGDRAALAAALATARASLSSGEVASPSAVGLAEAWTSLHQRLTGLESRMEAAGGGTEAIAARVDSARAAALAAEDAAVPRTVLPDEVAHLEELHDRMLEAESRAGKSVRRRAARAAFDEAQQELRDALDPLGYPAWAAFRMGNGMVTVTPEALEEYERTKVDLETAEVEWAELMARMERDTELQDVLNGIEHAFEHAVELLGHDPYGDGVDDDPTLVTDALRQVCVDAASVAVEAEAAIAHLRITLDEAGAKGHDNLESGLAVVAAGDAWLEVLSAADDAAVRILRDRERMVAELDALAELGKGTRVDRLETERDLVRSAERDVASNREALLEIATTRVELYVLAATELGLAERHDQRLQERDAAGHGHGHDADAAASEGAVRESSADAGARLARRIPRGYGGPIPLVVLMGASTADTLDALLELPDDVQALVVGDAIGLDAWLEKVGPGAACAVDAGNRISDGVGPR